MNPHARVGCKPKKLDLTNVDPTRCKAWNRKSESAVQCALDIGHYQDRLSEKPSPHVSETGEEWF